MSSYNSSAYGGTGGWRSSSNIRSLYGSASSLSRAPSVAYLTSSPTSTSISSPHHRSQSFKERGSYASPRDNFSNLAYRTRSVGSLNNYTSSSNLSSLPSSSSSTRNGHSPYTPSCSDYQPSWRTTSRTTRTPLSRLVSAYSPPTHITSSPFSGHGSSSTSKSSYLSGGPTSPSRLTQPYIPSSSLNSGYSSIGPSSTSSANYSHRVS